MAHIPYGYRIENGKAVPDEEQAEKLNAFLEGYLKGMSVAKARKAAGVDLTVSSLRDYMRSGTYEGTGYYPPIVPAGTHRKVREEMEKRTHPGTTGHAPPVPVQTEFMLREFIPTGTPAEKAEARYAAIEIMVQKGEI